VTVILAKARFAARHVAAVVRRDKSLRRARTRMDAQLANALVHLAKHPARSRRVLWPKRLNTSHLLRATSKGALAGANAKARFACHLRIIHEHYATIARRGRNRRGATIQIIAQFAGALVHLAPNRSANSAQLLNG